MDEESNSETENRMVDARGWVRRRSGELFNRKRLSVLQAEKIPEICGETTWIYLTLLSCILETG